jgi:tetratricopeptide (TPR) repeat protein
MDWLKPLLTIFYAPRRGMSLVRDRAPLGQVMLFALLAQASFFVVSQALFNGNPRLIFSPVTILVGIRESGSLILLTMLAFVPSVMFVGNLFERRNNTLLAIRQEFAPVASSILAAIAVANLISIPLAIVVHFLRVDIAFVNSSIEMFRTASAQLPPEQQNPEALAQMQDPRILSYFFYQCLLFPCCMIWTVYAISESYRFSLLRAAVVTVLGTIAMIPVFVLITGLIVVLGPFLSSPLLILLLFFYLRTYFVEVARKQRARLSFKQNLEAATLNPADASAHYNLGLLQLQRRDLVEARDRFEKAVKIDPEEIDSHYQLGRIARMQNRLQEAIAHFSEVVSRDDRHAQHEIWREIGETYLAAGQYADARDALEKFLERRQADPQGLYLMGRAEAGLGHRQEAAAAMQACIEAVKTAPDYKYRSEKRWLNEAQEFLGSRQ